MSDRLLFSLYAVSDGPSGWTVSRYPDLDHMCAPVALGTFATEDEADVAISDDVASQWWATRDAMAAFGIDHLYFFPKD